MTALISVIIPTYRRPQTLRCAVLSVLAQTYSTFEVIVVSDGLDSATEAAISGMDDRVFLIQLSENSGPAAARNAGVRQARGEWFAFLDDDDLWLPNKLEMQMTLADPATPNIMISCRSIYRRGQASDIWPAWPIDPAEDIADYLLLRKSLLGRPGIVTIQSLLIHRSIMLQIPFSNWGDHEDWSWLLEVWHRANARVRFLWEPLVIYNIDVEGISRSRRLNWQDSLDWAEAHRAAQRAWISDRVFCSFLATKVALKARRAGDWHGLARIAGLILHNRPSLLDLAFLSGAFLLPNQLLNSAWKHSLKRSGKAEDAAIRERSPG